MQTPSTRFLCPNFHGAEAELDQFRPHKGQNLYYRGELFGVVERVDGATCHHRKLNKEHRHDKQPHPL